MPGSIVQEKLLVQRFNRGDRRALHRMYDLYRVDLMTLAHALLFDKSDAEDVIHEVFTRLLDGPRIRIASSLRGYLFRAVANAARNANRRQRGSAVVRSGTVNSPLAASAERVAVQAEQCQKLTGALRELPYEQREVVLLRHYADLRFKAIAACQGVSVSTAQGRYRYGLEKLRSLLAGDL